MILLSHPTGNSNVRAAALGLLEKNILSGFRTSIATFPGDFLYRVGGLGPLAELRRRSFDIKLKAKTRMTPWKELGRIASLKSGLRKFVEHEKGIFCVDTVYQALDKKVARELGTAKKSGTKAVYSYEDGSLFSFLQAKKIGLKCFYDLPIGYWRSARFLLEMEKERWPEWASTITSFKDSQAKLQRKDEEINLADKIFVASSFTAKTLQDYPGALPPVQVIPYGFPATAKQREYTFGKSSRKLKLLFVGGLSQRKGIADLFSVAKELKSFVELTVIGGKVAANCDTLDKELRLHNYIPYLPNNEILKLMWQSDLFVFPSLFEGFGLVITEAMSQGTPVITTDRTAGPDLINNGENGWIIEAGSTISLKRAIENILTTPRLLEEAGKAARESASQRPWKVYGRELAEALHSQLF